MKIDNDDHDGDDPSSCNLTCDAVFSAHSSYTVSTPLPFRNCTQLHTLSLEASFSALILDCITYQGKTKTKLQPSFHEYLSTDTIQNYYKKMHRNHMLQMSNICDLLMTYLSDGKTSYCVLTKLGSEIITLFITLQNYCRII